MGNSNSNEFDPSVHSQLTLEDALKRSNQLMKQEERYFSPSRRQSGSTVFLDIPPQKNTYTGLSNPLQTVYDGDGGPHHSEQTGTFVYHATAQSGGSCDSNNPSLAYSEYNSDSSDEMSIDETSYTEHDDMYLYQQQSDLDSMHDTSMVSTNADIYGVYRAEPQRQKQKHPQKQTNMNTHTAQNIPIIDDAKETNVATKNTITINHNGYGNKSTAHKVTASEMTQVTMYTLPETPKSSVEHQLQFELDEMERLKQENELLRQQNELLRQQYQAHTGSPPVSNNATHSPPPQSTNNEEMEEKRTSPLAPTQSVTDEVLFEFVANAQAESMQHVDDHVHAMFAHFTEVALQEDLEHTATAKRKFSTGSNSNSSSKSRGNKKKKNKKKSKNTKTSATTMNSKQNECGSVKHCIAVKRLAKAMKWYQKYASDKEKLYRKIERKGYVEYMLNDYQHVLDVHLSDLQTDIHAEYDEIRERVQNKMKQQCAVNSCVGLKRLENDEYKASGSGGGNDSNDHNQNDDNHNDNMVSIQSMKDKIEFYAHSMDLIHCYLLHLDCLY